MSAPPGNRLDSWKEIASYLNRGVRTVRRWEREEGLPVHRHQHRVLGSVYAFKSEVDEWRATSRRPASGRNSRDRVARVIVDALSFEMSPEDRRRLVERSVDGAQAYACYLHARRESWRWRKDAIDHAVQTLRNGLTIVGDNAQLHAALGLAYLQYREAGIDLGERPLREAERCAARLFAIEPAGASGLQLRGWIEYGRGRIQEAVRDLKAALYADGSNADTLLLLSNCYLISGRVPEARPLIDRALALDPSTPLTRCMPAFADLLEGRFAAAVAPYQQMFEMDPGNPTTRLFYAWVLLLNRRTDAAAGVVDGFPVELQTTVPARIARFLVALAADRVRNGYAEVTPAVEATAAATDVFARMLAQGYAASGAADRAMRWLGVAVDRGFINVPFLERHDPFLEPLRRHPPFVALMETVRARWEAFEA